MTWSDIGLAAAMGLVVGLISLGLSFGLASQERSRRRSKSQLPVPSSGQSPALSQPSPNTTSSLSPPSSPSLSPSRLSTYQITFNATTARTLADLRALYHPASQKHSPDKTRYVYGYRGWNLDIQTGPKQWDVTGKTIQPVKIELQSANVRYGIWHPGLNVAICQYNKDHRAGQPGCSCGYWCLHNLSDVSMNVVRPQKMPGATAWGSVVGWGQCTRQGNGWRMEYAQVVAFMDPFSFPTDKPTTALPGYATVQCPHCLKWVRGPVLYGGALVDNRPGIDHLCQVNGLTHLYSDVEKIEVVSEAVNSVYVYRQHLKLLSERFDVPIVPEADLPAFTEKIVKAMYEGEEYDDRD